MEKPVDLVVIGGGAAGFFCAVNAARLQPGIEVIIIEKSTKLLSKVKISGGGRCNVTHACYNNRELIRNYPRGGKELLQAFSRFAPQDTVDWFAERGVELKTEADGRMFPTTDDSQTIIDCLLHEAETYGVQIATSAGVHSISMEEAGWKITFDGSFPVLYAQNILVATGGSRTMDGYRWLEDIGHSIVAPVPSLFTFNIPKNPITELMGVSILPATVKVQGTSIQTECPVLITHWGLSGPAILKASALGARFMAEKKYVFFAQINWLAGYHEDAVFEDLCWYKMQHPAQKVANTSHLHVPRRLWEFLVTKAGFSMEQKWGDSPHKLIRKLAIALTNDVYEVNGKTTFKEEFVTCGGINLKEVDFRTMESKIASGLFFAGEILDVDGVTGGFNFQNAWTTGFIAAEGVVANLKDVTHD